MKLKYKLYFILIVLLNFLLMYFIFTKKNTKIIDNTKERGLNSLVENLILENKSSFSLEGKKIKANDSFEDTLSVLVDKPKLVFKYSEEACKVCVDLALVDLKSLSNLIEDKDILIITSYNNENYFKAFKSSLSPNYSFINITDNSKFQVTGGLKKSISPHFFILNKDLTINCSYFYQKELPKLNEIYFTEIKNRFNN